MLNDRHEDMEEANGGKIGDWCVKHVQDFSYLFADYPSFNEPLENWNTHNAITFEGMFAGTAFNQPIGHWRTANVKSTKAMFAEASAFNQDLLWDTSSLETTENMFRDALEKMRR